MQLHAPWLLVYVGAVVPEVRGSMELDERLVAVDMAIEKNIRNRKYSGLEALDEEKQKLVEETTKDTVRAGAPVAQ